MATDPELAEPGQSVGGQALRARFRKVQVGPSWRAPIELTQSGLPSRRRPRGGDGLWQPNMLAVEPSPELREYIQDIGQRGRRPA
jgi:hypothetical protein